MILTSTVTSYASNSLRDNEGVYRFEKSEGAARFLGFEGREVEVSVSETLWKPKIIIKDLTTHYEIAYPLKGCLTEKTVVDSFMLIVFRMVDKFTMCAEPSENANILTGSIKALSYTDVMLVDPAIFVDEQKLNRTSMDGKYQVEFSKHGMTLTNTDDKGEVITKFIFARD